MLVRDGGDSQSGAIRMRMRIDKSSIRNQIDK